MLCSEIGHLCSWERVVLCPYEGQEKLEGDVRFVTRHATEPLLSHFQSGIVNLAGTTEAGALIYADSKVSSQVVSTSTSSHRQQRETIRHDIFTLDKAHFEGRCHARHWKVEHHRLTTIGEFIVCKEYTSYYRKLATKTVSVQQEEPQEH